MRMVLALVLGIPAVHRVLEGLGVLVQVTAVAVRAGLADVPGPLLAGHDRTIRARP
jgi:hypothetical protein